MIYPDLRDETLPPKNKLEEDLYASKSEPEAYVTAYVSKMFAVRAGDLPENKKKTLTAEEMRARARELRLAREAAANADKAPTPEPISRAQSEAPAADDADETKEKDVEVILGFARLYSGTLNVGSTVYAVLPKYNAALDPTAPSNARHIVKAEVEALYVMMGRELVAVNSVRAGNIFAIKGLEGKVWRSATLCSLGANASSDAAADLAAQKPCLINFGAVRRSVSCSLYILPVPLLLRL